MMTKGFLAMGLVIAAAVEPVASETDLLRYSITQGGLLAVVLVLAWYIKNNMGALIRQRDEQLAKKDETIALLVGIVTKSTEALMRSGEADVRLAEAGRQNADAIKDMARAIDAMNTRRA